MKRYGVAAMLFVLCSVLAQPAGAMPLHTPAADEWVPSQIQPTDIPLKWSRATLNDDVTLDQYGRRPIVAQGDTSIDSDVYMLACERPEQLDCIESFGVLDDSTGEFRALPMLRAHTWDVKSRPDLPSAPPYSMHRTVWAMPGLQVEGYPAHLSVVASLVTTGGFAFHIGFGVEDVPPIPAVYPNIYGCDGYFNDPCFRRPLVPVDVRLQMVLRTSWLDPAVMMARIRNPRLKVEDLGNGAHRIIVSGNPLMLQGQGAEELITGVTKAVSTGFDFQITDPRLARVGSAECYRSGPLLAAYNGSEGSVPEWVASEGRLKLNIVAPHYWPDAKTEWRGYYETAIPEKTARCLWGIDPRMTTALKVEVYDQNGEEKAATTSIAFTDGEVRIRAYDFTFSEPTIAVKVTVKPGQRCYQSGAQVGQYFCTKKGKRLVWVKRR